MSPSLVLVDQKKDLFKKRQLKIRVRIKLATRWAQNPVIFVGLLHSTFWWLYIAPVKTIYFRPFIEGISGRGPSFSPSWNIPTFQRPAAQVHDYAKSLSYSSFDDQASFCPRGCRWRRIFFDWRKLLAVFFVCQEF